MIKIEIEKWKKENNIIDNNFKKEKEKTVKELDELLIEIKNESDKGKPKFNFSKRY